LLLDSDESEERKLEVLEQSAADFPLSTTDDVLNPHVDINDTYIEEIEQTSNTDLEQTSTTRESPERRYPSGEH